MDALNSTSIANGHKEDSSPRGHNPKSHNRANHHDRNSSKPNSRSSVPHFSNKNKSSSTSAQNGHSKDKFYKSTAINGAAKNAVIVYYNDPQAEINVDQLLTKNESNKNAVTNTSNKPTKFNIHRQNASRGYHEHQSKYSENWRQPKPSKTEHPNRPFNGHNGNNGTDEQTKDPNNQMKEKEVKSLEPITIYYSAIESRY